MESASGDGGLAAYHREEVADCQRCALAGVRRHVIVGTGPAGADLMLVGRAPTFEEDDRGAPLLGPAGELLDQCLAGIGLTRRRVFCTTLVKCRPPGGREPAEAEVAACEAHLHRQIELGRPRVVATFGSLASRIVSGRDEPLSSAHGVATQITVAGRTVAVVRLYDPAAVLDSELLRRALESDFRAIGEMLGVSAATDVLPPAAAAEQLDLFA